MALANKKSVDVTKLYAQDMYANDALGAPTETSDPEYPVVITIAREYGTDAHEIGIALQERLEGEVPDNIVEEEERMLLQSFFQQLQQQGLTFDFYLQSQGLTSDQFKEDIKKQARDVATQDAALDAWARHADYTITDEEISEEFVKSGAKDPEAMEAEWRENGQLHTLRRSIKRTRAVMEIMDSAIVTERAEDEDAADEK